MKLPQKIKKIAVFRALQLGDMLCAIPAMRALRHAYPEAKITLIGLPWVKSLVSRFPKYFDGFIEFTGFPSLPERETDIAAFPDFLKQVQQEQFDLVLQMQGSGAISNLIVSLFGGKHTAGFYLEGNYCPDEELYLPYPDDLHETERHLALMNHLGISSQGTAMEFPLTEEDINSLAAAELPIVPQQYVCVHPGSRDAKRQWPTAYFAELADICAEKGLKVVITGTKDEMHIVKSVQTHMKYPAIIAAGKTSLGAVAALIKDAFALISNCTGVSHIAAAFETPSLIISMDGEPERWTPLNKAIHKSIDWTRAQDFDKTKQLLADLFSVASQRYHLRNEHIALS